MRTKNNGGFHDSGNKLRISLKSAKLNKRLVEICHSVTSNTLLQYALGWRLQVNIRVHKITNNATKIHFYELIDLILNAIMSIKIRFAFATTSFCLFLKQKTTCFCPSFATKFTRFITLHDVFLHFPLI